MKEDGGEGKGGQLHQTEFQSMSREELEAEEKEWRNKLVYIDVSGGGGRPAGIKGGVQ